MNAVASAHDAALMHGEFRNVGVALVIVAIVLVLLWLGTEFRPRALLDVAKGFALGCAALLVLGWIALRLVLGII